MAIAPVQTITLTGTGPGVSASGAVTTTAGNAFLFFVTTENTTFNSVADSKGNTWVEVTAISPLVTGFGNEQRVFSSVTGLGGATHTFSVNTGAGSFPSGLILEISQADLASILGGATPVAANDTSTPFSGGAPTPPAGNFLLVSFIGSNSGENPVTYTPNGGFSAGGSILNGAAFWTCAIATRVVTTPAAYDPAWTGSAGVSSTGVMLIAIKEASGGGGSTPTKGRLSLLGVGV